MGLAEPLALLFAGLYGVLVLFYLWERRRRQVTVPSLLLWATVPEDVIRARRFQPDLLFLLELLVLSCLIAGLARPYLHGPAVAGVSSRHILLLDTSASMQAREGQTSRFEMARAQALQRLSSLPSDTEVMLVSAAHTPEVLANLTRDHAAVAQALERTTPTDTGADLAVALAFVEEARKRSDVPTTVDVFTDIPRSTLPRPLRDQATVFQVGETDDNLGIEALQIFQGRFQDYRRARAYVLVENFSHREGHGFLTVRLQDQIVKRSGFTIAPRQSQGFLIHDFPGPGRVMAQLEGADALAADNTAYAWIRPRPPLHVLVVSPPSPLLDDLRELAAATPALQFTYTSPEEFRVQAAQQADAVIFHRCIPQDAGTRNALYIYPPAQNPLFPSVGDAENVEVLDWNARHAALQSLRPLATLPLQRARIISPPPWSDVLLWSRTADREFPLAFAGQYHAHRVACLTYDVESERLLSTENVNEFLFFMNLLGWLAPDSEALPVAQTGEVVAFHDMPAGALQVTDPHGRISVLPEGQTAVQPLLAGEYHVRVDGTERTLLANFFDPIESDIGRASREPPVFQRVAETTGTASSQRAIHNEYRPWLYAAALLFLVLEWVAARRVAR